MRYRWIWAFTDSAAPDLYYLCIRRNINKWCILRTKIFRLLATYHDEVRPDIVVLGKALSGGMYPVSFVHYAD